MTTRLVAIVPKGNIKIEADGADRKKITFGKGGNLDNRQIKTEGGAGVNIINHANANAANEIRTGVNGTDNTTFSGATIQGVIFKFADPLGEKFARFLAWKEEVREAKAVFTDVSVVLTGLAYDGGATTGTAGTGPANTFILDGTNIVIKEDSFATVITNWNSLRNNIKFLNVDISKDLDANDYASVHSPGISGAVTDLDDGFKEEVETFEETENLIVRLHNDYGTSLTNLPTLAVIEGDLDALTSYLGGLGTGGYKTGNATDVTLKGSTTAKKVNAIIAARGTATEKADVKALAKRALYGIDTFNNTPGGGASYPKYYKTEIDKLILFLSELKIWKKAGFNTVDEIAQANANGYTVYNRGTGTGVGSDVTIGDNTHKGKIVPESAMGGADTFSLTGVVDPNATTNLTAIEKYLKDRKYRGVDIAECMVETGKTAKTPASTTKTESHKVFRKIGQFGDPTSANGIEFAASTTLKYKKNQIDSFLHAEWFNKEDYDASLTVQDWRGFKIEDFVNNNPTVTDGGSFFTGHGAISVGVAKQFKTYDPGTGGLVGTANESPTFLCEIVMSAPNIQAAINLAFFGQAYFKDNSKFFNLLGTTTKDDRWDGKKYKLFLDEVKNKSKLDHLNLYYGWLLEKGDIGSQAYQETPEDFNGTDWSGETDKTGNLVKSKDATADGSKAKAKAAYGEVKKLLDILAKPYNDWAKGKAGTEDKGKLKTMKTELEAIKAKKLTATDFASCTTDEQKVAFCWESEITTRISAVEALIRGFDPNTPKMSKEAKDVLNVAKTAETADSEAQKFYGAFLTRYDTDAGVDKDVAEKVVKIVKAVKEFEASPNEANCKALIALGSANDAAWQKAKDVESDGKKWVEEVLTKAQNKLTELINAARKKLQDVTGGGDNDIYKKISEGKQDDISFLEKAAQYYGECAKAWGETVETTENSQLMSTLNSHSAEDAWKAIDKHQHTSGKPYGTGAIEHLESLKKKSKESLDKYLKVDEVKSTADVNKIETEAKKSPDWGSMEVRFNEIKPILLVVGKLREKTNPTADQTAFINLITPFVKDKTMLDYNDDNSPTDLAALEKAEKEIKAKKSVYEELGEEYKKNVESLLSKISSRIAKMKQAQNKKDNEDDNKNNGGKNPWTSMPAIIAYCVIGAAVIGGIAWLAFKGKSEEEEEME